MDDDAIHVRAALAGDREAFDRLVRIHQARLRCDLARLVADAHVVDDLAQEAFIRAYRGLERYDPARPFRHWLGGIARHLAIDHLRRHGRERQLAGDVLEAVISARVVEQPPQPLEDDRGRVLAHCLGRLPPRNRRILQAFYCEGTSVATLAARSRKSHNAVRLWLQRIRRAVRACVERSLIAEGGA